ncbi:protein of unknown function [Streptomyces murinus]
MFRRGGRASAVDRRLAARARPGRALPAGAPDSGAVGPVVRGGVAVAVAGAGYGRPGRRLRPASAGAGAGAGAAGASAGLRLALLGPVRAWRGEEVLATGSPQQRALLAALLLREGRTATAAELIDALWGPNRRRRRWRPSVPTRPGCARSWTPVCW